MKILSAMADDRHMVEIGGDRDASWPDGLILTNKHVIDDASAEYTVILNDGRWFTANILTRDPINDIAIPRSTPKASFSQTRRNAGP